MLQLTPTQLVHHLQSSAVKPFLLDVREPSEYKICAMDDSINVPLARIPEAIGHFDPKQEYVLICHHGVRSQHAGAFMAAQGFEKLINLVGGIEAWACDIDPGMARY